MAEGDTILRAAGRIERAMLGQPVQVEAPSPRGEACGVRRLDGLRLRAVSARGKHLLLDFGELVLHSHLGMSGAWHVYPRGERWTKSSANAWVVLRGREAEAVQFGGPTLRVLSPAGARRELGRLGPDILAAAYDEEAALASLRRGDPAAPLGEVLLDQGLIAGIGNIFKSEGCFAARISPWRPLGGVVDAELGAVLLATRGLMQDAVAGAGRRGQRAVYRRAGEPCRACGAAILSRGQGDANRATYWCPRCQL